MLIYLFPSDFASGYTFEESANSFCWSNGGFSFSPNKISKVYLRDPFFILVLFNLQNHLFHHLYIVFVAFFFSLSKPECLLVLFLWNNQAFPPTISLVTVLRLENKIGILQICVVWNFKSLISQRVDDDNSGTIVVHKKRKDWGWWMIPMKLFWILQWNLRQQWQWAQRKNMNTGQNYMNRVK